MLKNKEHILAIKISILLLLFAFIITFGFQYLNHIGVLDFKKGLGNNKLIIFIILSFITYFISYFLAKITIEPIEENNKKLKEYNHNLAHEIKTPLAVINSNLELLELSYDRNLISSSKEEIASMVDITDSLLFLSENNELKEKEKINTLELLEKYLGNDLKINNKESFIINGNKNLIDRLLKNLIENSRKFSKKDENIGIEINKNNLIILNTFEGSISKNDLDHLLDTFYKVDNSRGSTGYGLGLSIVSKICTLHNLKINISIENNKFIVSISN